MLNIGNCLEAFHAFEANSRFKPKFGLNDNNGDNNMAKLPDPSGQEQFPFLGQEDARKLAGAIGKMAKGTIVEPPRQGKTQYGERVFVASRFGKLTYIVALDPTKLNYQRLHEAYGNEPDDWKGKIIRVGIGKSKAGKEFTKVEAK